MLISRFRAHFIEKSGQISNIEVDEHLVDVLFLLLDEDEDQKLSLDELAPLIADFRLSRAFMQASASGASILEIKFA